MNLVNFNVAGHIVLRRCSLCLTLNTALAAAYGPVSGSGPGAGHASRVRRRTVGLAPLRCTVSLGSRAGNNSAGPEPLSIGMVGLLASGRSELLVGLTPTHRIVRIQDQQWWCHGKDRIMADSRLVTADDASPVGLHGCEAPTSC